MTTYVGILGVKSPLPQTANNPVPIVGANAANIIGDTSPLTQVAGGSVVPIIGANVIAILFPTVQGGSFGGPI